MPPHQMFVMELIYISFDKVHFVTLSVNDVMKDHNRGTDPVTIIFQLIYTVT